MAAPTNRVPMDRANKLTELIVLGQPMPDDLTEDERDCWASIEAEVKANPGRAYSPLWDG